MPNLHIDLDIARASTLPAPLYFSPETFEKEKKSIFAATWQVVGHIQQAAKPGDYFTFDLLGEPLLIARGEDGVLVRLPGLALFAPAGDGMVAADARSSSRARHEGDVRSVGENLNARMMTMSGAETPRCTRRLAIRIRLG